MASRDADTSSSKAISYCSSLEQDRWHDIADAGSFESWHFDAISDDGTEALVITFYDNYVLSPRFHGTSADGARVQPGRRYPALSVAYVVDGAAVVDVINEYDHLSFHPGPGRACGIAGSGFVYTASPYGDGFLIKLDLALSRGRHLRGELEWLTIDGDLDAAYDDAPAVWNIAVPRADVSGRLTIFGAGHRLEKQAQFRGTGYHDHIISRHAHYGDLDSRMWGRAHLSDCTVVFERHGGVRNPAAPGAFFVVRNGSFEHRSSSCQALGQRRDRYGLVIPEQMWFRSNDGVMVRIRPGQVLRSGFYETKMLSHISLGLGDGCDRSAVGITEFVNPQRLRSGLFRWVSGLGIKRVDEHAGDA